MFGGFNKQVEYRECIGKDKTNSFKYAEPVNIPVRYCGVKDEAKYADQTKSVERIGTYHTNQSIKENSLIDGHLVKYVSESVDVLGNVLFWVVKVKP